MTIETALALLISLAGLAAFAWVIRNEYRRTRATDDGVTWTQSGVTVDTARQTIQLWDHTIPAASVTSVTTGRSRNRGQGSFPAAVITTDLPGLTDLRIPFALKGSATGFAWGLREALTRAGNPHPQATNKPFSLGKAD